MNNQKMTFTLERINANEEESQNFHLLMNDHAKEFITSYLSEDTRVFDCPHINVRRRRIKDGVLPTLSRSSLINLFCFMVAQLSTSEKLPYETCDASETINRIKEIVETLNRYKVKYTISFEKV